MITGGKIKAMCMASLGYLMSCFHIATPYNLKALA